MERTASWGEKVNLNSSNKPVCLIVGVSKDWESIPEAWVGRDWEAPGVPGYPSPALHVLLMLKVLQSEY